MYCPKCRAEYRDESSFCADRRVALADGKPTQWSNQELRAEAAILIRRFRDGKITNFQFEHSFEEIRHRSNDRALQGIATALWGLYDDLREHKLTGRHGLTSETTAWFDRCILFVQSDLPYLWERDLVIGIAVVSPVLRAASKCAKRILLRTPEGVGLRPGPDTKQDWELWPFSDEQDLRRSQARGQEPSA
jgi:hypothetical protein